jgi:sucrose-6-phosphate hydrolase SacC (GH32 family)
MDQTQARMPTSLKPSRRTFLEGLSLLLLPRLSLAVPPAELAPVLRWKLSGEGSHVLEAYTGASDDVTSRPDNVYWSGSGNDRALRLDGYSVGFSHHPKELRLGAFTLAAWVALEAYPVHEAAILALASATGPIFHLSLDSDGFLKAGAASGTESGCKSQLPVPRNQWVHVAVTLTESGSAVLYQDGVACTTAAATFSGLDTAAVQTIAFAKLQGSPVVAKVFPTGVVNGLLREACLFDRALTLGELREWMLSTRPLRAADLQLNRDWCAADPQRPLFHAMPSRAWTNEPHGCLFFQGRYHLFYQKNANGPYWGNINWGHMTSPDLYQWTDHLSALTPSPGPDSEGCWSGSAIEHEGKLAVIYTGGDGKRASLCLATSDDGMHFIKYANNPVVPAVPEGHNYPEFRDPFVWKDGSTYYMVVGSAIKDVGGAALLYRSADLISWQYLHPLLTGQKETSGVFWEMPVFVKVGEYHVLIVCEVPGRGSYWVGHWRDEQFHPLSTEPQRMELFNHLLSPTPLHDANGRAIVMGIIPDERSPEETWKAGWAHLYSLPRVLSVGADGRLQQAPLEGVRAGRKLVHQASGLVVPAGERTTLHPGAGTGVEIELELERGQASAFSLFLRSSADGQESTAIRFDWEAQTITLDRTHSSLNPHVRRDTKTAPLRPAPDGRLRYDLFLDRSVLEVFVDGHAAFATRIYPTLPGSDALQAVSTGGPATVRSLAIHSIPPRAARAQV